MFFILVTIGVRATIEDWPTKVFRRTALLAIIVDILVKAFYMRA